MENKAKTFILLAALTALLLVVGNLLGGHTGLVIALALAVIMNFSAYWYSDQIVLRAYQAQPLDETHPVYTIVSELAKKAQIPMPKVYYVDTPVPNAFATGRNPEHASVAVTTGILSRMNKEELAGVLAHELSHVIHRDTLISAVAATISGAIGSLANIFMWSSIARSSEDDRVNPIAAIAMTVLAPLAAGLIQMAVSRSCEFDADASGAKLCGNPLWLASALAKLEEANGQGQFQAADEHPNTAHMFIVNPLSAAKLTQLFSTHPPTEERIRRLQAMARETWAR
ncbi:zinc metalloprotease HtpX [Legionella micdadei]|uniref:Protease HtpX n=1 Tax=Legionella micdadei TaxID=451 RepID=A0A098GIN7_LEGMI|nr:zinc metalloprotease HtpX [Legionella micdadei]ARG96774.1 protease HtpX [Legionella micdadei]ARG99507.1 protease HtpX [Legionella micdadei]KTD26443.1 M48 family peptidase [Legionella micdadei]NSL17965.1 zinc metalloprotease HtpX [Legionella micdadei]CEG61840.1 Protease HtpX [Legionella micdadei]